MNNKRITEMSEREYREFVRDRRAKAQVKANARINITRLIIGVLIVMFIVIGFRCATRKVSATNKIDTYKYYKTVRMSYDQTLRDVAVANFDEHYDSIEDFYNEIKNINNVTEGSAIPGGKILYIPYYDIPMN